MTSDPPLLQLLQDLPDNVLGILCVPRDKMVGTTAVSPLQNSIQGPVTDLGNVEFQLVVGHGEDHGLLIPQTQSTFVNQIEGFQLLSDDKRFARAGPHHNPPR